MTSWRRSSCRGRPIARWSRTWSGPPGYNLVAIPVAAGVFVPWGIDLPMAVGAIAMSVSTIIVAANAQLLRRLRLRREHPARRASAGHSGPVEEVPAPRLGGAGSGRERVGRCRPTKKESPVQLDAELQQHRPLLLGLDAFGDELRSCRFREVGEARDERATDRVALDAAHPLHVQLHEAGLKAEDVLEAGIARSRVVNRQADRRAEAGKTCANGSVVIDPFVFGQLDDHGPLSHGKDLGRRCLVLEHVRGDIRR